MPGNERWGGGRAGQSGDGCSKTLQCCTQHSRDAGVTKESGGFNECVSSVVDTEWTLADQS
jgi:hypothetical protein